MRTYTATTVNVLAIPGIRDRINEQRAALAALRNCATLKGLPALLDAIDAADLAAWDQPGARTAQITAQTALLELPEFMRALCEELADSNAYVIAMLQKEQAHA